MNSERKLMLIAAIGIPLLVSVFILAICVGRYSISPEALLAIITGDRASYPMEWNILSKLRIPRTLAALTVGIGLSVSGLLYQELFQNKLVSPDLLGVSEGAGVGAALAILLGWTTWFITGMAFVTGLISVLAAISIAKVVKGRSSATLLLSGVMVGCIANSAVGFIKYMAGPEATLASIEFWLMGSCEYVTMDKALLLVIIMTVCLIVIMPLKWRINLVALGREECSSRGMKYKKYMWGIIGLATLMTASTVAVVGCVSLIGLVIPHISRLIVGRNTKFSIPMTVIFGGVFMIFADMFCRCLTTSEMPLLVFTGLFGAGVFIILMFVNGGKVDERL